MQSTKLRHSKSHRKKVRMLKWFRFKKKYSDEVVDYFRRNAIVLTNTPFIESLKKRSTAAKI